MKYFLIFLLSFSLHATEETDDKARLLAIRDYLPLIVPQLIAAYPTELTGKDLAGVKKYIYETAGTETIMAHAESLTTTKEVEHIEIVETLAIAKKELTKFVPIVESGNSQVVEGLLFDPAIYRTVVIKGSVNRKSSTSARVAHVTIILTNLDGVWYPHILKVGPNHTNISVNFDVQPSGQIIYATAGIGGVYDTAASKFSFSYETIKI